MCDIVVGLVPVVIMSFQLNFVSNAVIILVVVILVGLDIVKVISHVNVAWLA